MQYQIARSTMRLSSKHAGAISGQRQRSQIAMLATCSSTGIDSCQQGRSPTALAACEKAYTTHTYHRPALASQRWTKSSSCHAANEETQLLPVAFWQNLMDKANHIWATSVSTSWWSQGSAETHLCKREYGATAAPRHDQRMA